MKKSISITMILLLCALLTACSRNIRRDEEYVRNIEGRILFIAEQNSVYDFSGDAAETVAFVEAVHPNFIVADRMCMDKYAYFRDTYLTATANPMTHTEFTLATQRFLTVFNDGHLSRTFLMGKQVWNPQLSEYRWETTLFQDGYFIEHFFLAREDRLFLADDNLVITDTEVLAIGGVPVADIFAVIDYYFGAYNDVGIQRARGRYARYQLMLQLAGANLYLREDYLVVDITVLKNEIETIMEVGFTSLHPAAYRLPDFELEYRVRWERMKNDVFYISLRSLALDYPYNIEMSHAIRQAMNDGIRNFIIDLRNTPGGNPAIIHYIFQEMGATTPGHGKIMRIDDMHREIVELHYPPPTMERYFGHLSTEDFAGRSYIYTPRNPGRSANPRGVFIAALTSERTFSGGTTIAVEIADSGFGIVIGEPSATAPTGYGWGRALWLPNSFLQIRPHYTFYLRPDINADQFTLWPDIYVNEWEALETALAFFMQLP